MRPKKSGATPEELSPEEWEALCKRCGQCCFEKWVEEDGTIRPTTIPCRFLDIVTRECKVYHKRFEVDEGCVKLTPALVETVQWLPPDCAYVRWMQGKR
ncbi:YkgJ family cysteine cluster protein [Trichloromonas sp.]|uniref:YkgJ family cysteine cluster protein n=1 Tax=Trichloromonas sp. TaxID=3069249 RepID=UPI002A49EC2E|nr:hypothetical protein [Trichloromonas sp.]